MKRTSMWTLVVLLVGGFGGQTRADEAAVEPVFAERGHVVISAERMFGYLHTTQTNSVDGITDTRLTTEAFSVLGSPPTGIFSFYTFPRIGIDLFAAAGITIGAAVSYLHFTQTLRLGPDPASKATTTGDGFLLAPRVGFAARVGAAVWIWPRVGVTYVSVSGSTTIDPPTPSGAYRTNLLAATVEAPVAVAISPRTFILVGPTADIGISGSDRVTQASAGTVPDESIKITEYGVQAGLLVLL